MSDNAIKEFSLDETLCNNCVNRFSKLIVPLDYEDWGIDLDDFDLEEGEEVMVEHHMCLITGEDLDGVVKECNKFKDEHEETFFIDNPYKR
jgi:hypothetical protein